MIVHMGKVAACDGQFIFRLYAGFDGLHCLHKADLGFFVIAYVIIRQSHVVVKPAEPIIIRSQIVLIDPAYMLEDRERFLCFPEGFHGRSCIQKDRGTGDGICQPMLLDDIHSAGTCVQSCFCLCSSAIIPHELGQKR